MAVGLSLALGQAAESKPVLSGKYGGFEHYKDADPINDEDRSYIVSRDDEGDNLIFWKCEYDGLNILFRAGGQYYSDDNDHNVLYRFDKKKALELDGWTPGADNDTLYMPLKSVKQFTKEALSSGTMVIRSTDSSNDTVTSIFDLTALGTALSKLSCYKP